MNTDIENIEIDIFLEAVFKCYGYDFRHYARASLKRRIKNLMNKNGYDRINDMTSDIIHDRSFFEKVVYGFSITVTEMFRDPSFYLLLREKIIPYLRTYPFIKIWHAGCATGEEVYSLAIILKEEGIYNKTTIFATDFNGNALDTARQGIYSLKDMQTYTINYQKAGGKASFADYYHAKYKSAIMSKALSQNVTFANHNLVTDSIFGEMHLILCRNVLIYFNRELQNRVLSLFNESIIKRGFLALGNKESIQFSNIENDFKPVDKKNKIFQKIKQKNT